MKCSLWIADDVDDIELYPKLAVSVCESAKRVPGNLRKAVEVEGAQLTKKNLGAVYRHRVSTQFSCKSHDPFGGIAPLFLVP